MGGHNSSDTDSDDSTSKKKKAAAKAADEDATPEEMVVIGTNGQQTKVITTVSGQIRLDFNNTRIIRDGKVIDPNDVSNVSSVQDLNRIKQCAQTIYDDNADQQRNYATDIGLFKAGMDNIDQDEVKRVIMESSGHSEYFKTQEQKHRQVEQKVRRYLFKLRNFKANKDLWVKTKEQVRKMIDSFIKQREVRRTWMHIDMDMFYAAVEIRDNPSLRNKPVAVGDNTMITTTNYIARKYGVKSAMPGFIGRRLCPHLVFIKPNIPKYRRVSDHFKRILCEYDAKIDGAGLDEANVDLTDYLVENNLDNDMGRIFVTSSIRERIFKEMGMTASAGIACNKMLSKICSELNKPNGQTYLPNDEVEVLKFMMDLPVRKVPGIGKVNEHILAGLNIYSCKDLVEKATEVFVTFTEWAFQFLVKSALGIGKVMHEKDDGVVAQRSMGVSCTFKPIHRYGQFLEKLFKLAVVLEDRAGQSKVMGKTLVLEFKNFKFETKIKSMTFPHYLYTQNQFKKYGMLLLNQAWPIEAIRLMGLRLQNMRDRRKAKGVNVCPELQICEDDYLKNQDNNGGQTQAEGDTSGQSIEEPGPQEDQIVFDDTHRPVPTTTVAGGETGGGADDEDQEGVDDADVQQRYDEENMKFAQDKIANKNKKPSYIKTPLPHQIGQGKEILGENSRSLQSWNNVPRFHMDKIMGRTDRERKQERLEKILKKRRQRGIESFLDADAKYCSTTDRLQKQSEEFDKVKNKNDGINNNRAIRNKQKKREEKIRKDIEGGMFGVPRNFKPGL